MTRILGVTATPNRTDGVGLGKAFQSVAYTYDLRRAIREQYLVQIRAKRIRVKAVDLDTVKIHHGDFDQAALGEIMAQEKALHGQVAPMLDLAGDRRTLAFGVDVAHAHALADMINRYKPASAIAVDGSASRAERAAALSLFRAGRFQFLTNCALYTEGFNEPSISCVALCRPTQSLVLHTQMLGRVTRLLGRTMQESIANGKLDGLALDFVGNSRHRLINAADALAGAVLDDAATALVEKKLEGDGDLDLETILDAAIEDAALKSEQQRSRADLIAIATYRSREIDIFVGDIVPPLDPNSAAAKRPATEKQLAALVRLGFGIPPRGLSCGEASRMFDSIDERKRRGLATVAQERLLGRWLNTKGMTKSRASELYAMAMKREQTHGKGQGFTWITFLGQPEFGRKKS